MDVLTNLVARILFAVPFGVFGLMHFLHAGDMALVIRSPNIYDTVKFSESQLIVMIGSIRSKIRGRTVAPHDDVVFILAQGG